MKNPHRFKDLEKEPFSIQLVGVLCGDRAAYKKYQKSYETLLSLVRQGVDDGTISPEEGRKMLEECRK